MIAFPDRISGLIEKLEAGNEVTQKELDDVARLQALDLIKAGEDFVRDAIERDNEYTETFKTL